jgi:SulP family sulfate permease
VNRQALARFFPFLAWSRPDRATLSGEAWAGVTVGLMVIPQGVAYAALAGMPLVTGIYASLLPALVAVLWSSSTRLGVGPTALTCLLVSSALSGMAAPGSADWVALAVWLALLSGGLQVLLGLARFGWLLNLVSSPVLTGFTQAAAILILLSQVPTLLGLQGGLLTLLAQPHLDLGACAFGLASLVTLILGKRWLPRVPTVVLVVLASSGLSAWLGFAQGGGAVVGALPAGLPSLYWPPLPSWPQFSSLIVPAMIITLVSFLETASSAKVENQSEGRLWNENQDLIGQGLAKIASALNGAFPTSSSFSRSAINLYAGARTGWANIVSVLLVLGVLLWGTPVLYHVPQSVLAAVVAAAVGGLVKPSALLRLWKLSRTEALTGATTFALTLATAPRLYWGVLAGLLMSMSHYLYAHLHPRIIEVGLHPDGSLRDRHLWHLPPLAPCLYALRMDAELDFASARSLERNIVEHLAAHPDVRHVCLLAQPFNRIDVTGAEVFHQLQAGLQAQGITLHISGIKLPVETVLRRSGALKPEPLLKMYRTDAEALQALAQIAQERAPASA